jgi:hypothetical protein
MMLHLLKDPANEAMSEGYTQHTFITRIQTLSIKNKRIMMSMINTWRVYLT